MSKKKPTTCLYDSYQKVQAGYANNEFFPTYNGKVCKHAELFNQLEMLEAEEGVVLEIPDGMTSVDVKRKMDVLLRRYGLRTIRGYKYHVRRYFDWDLGRDQVLISLVTLESLAKKKKKKTKPSKPRPVYKFVETDCSDDQILAEREAAQAASRALIEAQDKKLRAHRRKITEREEKLEARFLRKQEKAKWVKGSNKRLREAAREKWALQKKKAQEEYEMDFPQLLQAYKEKEKRLARRRAVRSRKEKLRQKEKRAQERLDAKNRKAE